MKRFFALIAAIMIILSLCSCKNNSAAKKLIVTENTETGFYTEMRRVALAIENMTYTDDFSSYNDEQKNEIKEYLARDKYNITYNKDGSANIEHKGKKWFLGVGWVENEFTQGIPEPNLGGFAQTMPDPYGDGKSYFFLIKTGGSETFEQYVQRVNDAGFKTIGTFPNEKNTFSAVKDGIRIDIFFMYKGYQLEISKLG